MIAQIQETIRRPRRLSSTLFFAELISSLVIVFCFVAAFLTFFYFSHEFEAEQRLQSMTTSAAKTLAEHPSQENMVDTLRAQLQENIRYTLIAPNGDVLFDNEAANAANHADRPEVQEAERVGSASVMRYSQTLGHDTIYAAIQLDNGYILRLAEERQSFFAVARSLTLPIFAALFLIVLLSFALSKLLTRLIVFPLDNVDVSQPMENQTYKEMTPLLKRIDNQQRQLKEQNNELARAENIRREFSANVSHEMKTPLQVISGYAELLENETCSTDDARKFAHIMQQESAHMKTLIDDILTLSRLDDPVMKNAGKEPVELLKLVQDCVRRLLPLARSYEVNLRAFGSTVEIMGNTALLEQLVNNLVSNAIRYSDRGGEVLVVVGKDMLDQPNLAYIRVQDSGCGIPLKEQEKIFERFYRVDKSRSRESGGTGLGLAIAKHAADIHDATINVESQPRCGATFTVRFPLV